VNEEMRKRETLRRPNLAMTIVAISLPMLFKFRIKDDYSRPPPLRGQIRLLIRNSLTILLPKS